MSSFSTFLRKATFRAPAEGGSARSTISEPPEAADKDTILRQVREQTTARRRASSGFASTILAGSQKLADLKSRLPTLLGGR